MVMPHLRRPTHPLPVQRQHLNFGPRAQIDGPAQAPIVEAEELARAKEQMIDWHCADTTGDATGARDAHNHSDARSCLSLFASRQSRQHWPSDPRPRLRDGSSPLK